MKTSRKIGLKAFYLLFILIIVFVVTELMKTFISFGMSLDGWKLALGTALGLLGIVWGGIATGNLKKKINEVASKSDVPPGGN